MSDKEVIEIAYSIFNEGFFPFLKVMETMGVKIRHNDVSYAEKVNDARKSWEINLFPAMIHKKKNVETSVISPRLYVQKS